MDNKLKQEVYELVEQLVSKHAHVSREQIMQLLTESDKDKTQCLMAIEALKHEIYRNEQEQDKRLTNDITEEVWDKLDEQGSALKNELKIAIETHTNFVNSSLAKNKIPWLSIISTLVAVATLLLTPLAVLLYDNINNLWALRVDLETFKEQLKHRDAVTGARKQVPVASFTPSLSVASESSLRDGASQPTD